MIRRDPVGVVGPVTPWNYPLMMATWKIGAGAAGRQHHGAETLGDTPLTTLKLGRRSPRLFPEGVFNVVTGRGHTVGNALINHPEVEMISLTGDIATGQKVLEAARRR